MLPFARLRIAPACMVRTLCWPQRESTLLFRSRRSLKSQCLHPGCRIGPQDTRRSTLMRLLLRLIQNDPLHTERTTAWA